MPGPLRYRTEVNGLVVSTVMTFDMGWETAILDVHSAYPVERYASEELACEGHERWCSWAADSRNTTVHRVGWFLGIGEKDFLLERIPGKAEV